MTYYLVYLFISIIFLKKLYFILHQMNNKISFLFSLKPLFYYIYFYLFI